MTDPTTEAGRELLASDFDTTGWGPSVVRDHVTAAVLAIEAEARAEERERRQQAREQLAALEHEQWEKWSREVAATGLTPDRIDRWERYWVPYVELDEATKDHDRVWADRVLAILDAPQEEADHD